MKSCRYGRGVSLLWAALGMKMVLGSAAWATVEVTVPADFQILAVSAGTLHDEQHATLPDGEQQLLVRYEGVIPSRSSSENDRQLRSAPQVLRYQASQQQVRLVANLPSDERGMAQYAESPVMGLQAGGQSIASQQDALVTSGMLIGMDWRAKLAEYNQSGGKAVVPVTATAGAVEPVAASALEGQLQQLFLKADPALRKRFVSWAVPRL
ncbi:DUF2057 domain-containing protein [Aeromonas hydrophila]|uniref:DUF2057 domain-containing protein n=1 Tax=Aeromonas hydrophila TaxID=644 RepID=UPI001CC3956F|nr:DUF2057 domain-containing protein [Aeromonas hydrophila]GJC06944.1 DUF2057 domain-containing protein [Aeromonas hydrophila]